jgi:hypothetical protein
MATAFLANWTSKLINPIPLYLALCDAYKLILNKENKTKA